MRFFRDTMCHSVEIIHGSGVSAVLKSSCIIYTLRFSALASCVALSPASMQSCARCFLALMYRDVLYAGIAGAKTGHEKITILEMSIIN